ncbi:uncharacterized protein [Scyliorhinus torazame]|uniref:uncharacterized protein n=1 Tax=Scyliorhinus torazame TaxID=75743 RepID=UPI003B59DD81
MCKITARLTDLSSSVQKHSTIKVTTHESSETTSIETSSPLNYPQENEILKILTPEEEHQETKDDSNEPEMTAEEEHQGSKEGESNPPQMTDVTKINATPDHSHNPQEETLNETSGTTKHTDTNNFENDSNYPHGTVIERNKNNKKHKKHNRNSNNKSNKKHNKNNNKKHNKDNKSNDKHDKKKKNNNENKKNRNKHDKNNKNDNENDKDRNDNNETTTCTTWYNSAHEGQCNSTLQNNDKSTNIPSMTTYLTNSHLLQFSRPVTH